MIGLEYIMRTFEYEFQDIALLFRIDKANISIWLKGERKIPKKWISPLAEYFQLPEHLFQKDLTVQEQLKINIQHLGSIPFNDSPDDLDELIKLNGELAGTFNFINSSTPKLAEVDRSYRGAEDELHQSISVTAQHYISSISRVESFMKNIELDLDDKETIFRLIHLVTLTLDKAIEADRLYDVSEDIEGVTGELLSELILDEDESAE